MLFRPVSERLRFRVDWDKCVQGIDLIASKYDGITQYYIGKAFYYADKEHFIDWGRPVSGDRYIAMEHGPVPSRVYSLLKSDADDTFDKLGELLRYVDIEQEGNLLKVHSKGVASHSALSATDKEYLLRNAAKVMDMSFARLRRLSHEEKAYKQAEDTVGINSEMDLTAWIDDLDSGQEEYAAFKTRLIEESRLNTTKRASYDADAVKEVESL